MIPLLVLFLCISVSTLQLNSSVYQSSTDWGGTPEKAIDENLDGNYFRGESCSHTKEEDDPWWILDLGRGYLVSHIVVSIRTDCCGMYVIHYQGVGGNIQTSWLHLCTSSRTQEHFSTRYLSNFIQFTAHSLKWPACVLPHPCIIWEDILPWSPFCTTHPLDIHSKNPYMTAHIFL